MTLIEFIAIEEETSEEWAEKLIKGLLNEGLAIGHFGDCTDDSQPCALCTLETIIVSYREFVFNSI